MPHNTKNTLNPEQKEIFKTANTVNTQLNTLETFIARRFDEISMEINASAQQADMAEDGVTKRFSEILEVLSAINYSGDGNSAANTGVELESIIKETETAANTILDASDRITDCISDAHDWSDKKISTEMRGRINNDIQDILMACSFQDLTGQRIRNTLDNLHDIEEKLNTTFDKLGLKVDANKKVIEEKVSDTANQGDIDDLFD